MMRDLDHNQILHHERKVNSDPLELEQGGMAACQAQLPLNLYSDTIFSYKPEYRTADVCFFRFSRDMDDLPGISLFRIFVETT